MAIKNTDEGLKRVIGTPALAASVVNFTIGAGIYALPAIVAMEMGAAAITGYFFCSIMLAAIMLCYVEIGSRVNTSGGSYAYVEAAFGPFAGFIINWLFFFGWGVLGSAALMNIIADSLSVLFPAFSHFAARAALFFILIGFMISLNVRSAKKSVRFVSLIAIIKLIPLLAIIIFGFSHVKASNLHWEHLPSLKTFGDTSLILFFAFAGFETSLNVSGEIKNPKRSVPLGILLGAGLVFIIYLLIQTVTQGILGAEMANFKDAPLAAVAEKIIGPAGGTILLIAAIVSCVGSVSGDVLASPRLLFAGANDGLFPRFLTKVHSRFATPYMAIITYASLIFIFSISGGFKQLAVLASGTILIIYLAVIIAMIKLRKRTKDNGEKSFSLPGGLLIPIIGIASIVWLLMGLSKVEILSLLVFLVVVCIIYFLMKFFKKAKSLTDNPLLNKVDNSSK